MYAIVHFGYRNGVRVASSYGSGPHYANMFSGNVRGMPVLHLYPFDVPVSGGPEGKPYATLWRPVLSVVLVADFAVTGLERIERGDELQWVVQRWMIQPASRSFIVSSITADQARRPVKAAPHTGPRPCD